MEELENKGRKDEIFSRTVRAGKRTYFFDVKVNVSDEHYITITESKKRFNEATGSFVYDKHKLFLYKEDFEKFANGLSDVIEFIETGNIPPVREPYYEPQSVDIDFDDLSFNTEV